MYNNLIFIRVVMFRAVVFVVFVVSVSAEDDMRKCGRLLHPDSLRCCNKIPVSPPSDIDNMKECLDLPFKPRSCEREECFAKKKGYYVSGGGIDMEAFVAIFEKDFEKSPEFLSTMKDTCFKDVSKYGPPDMCDLVKMRHCIHTQMLKNCGEWNDEGKCSGIKDLVEECTNKFA